MAETMLLFIHSPFGLTSQTLRLFLLKFLVLRLSVFVFVYSFRDLLVSDVVRCTVVLVNF